MCYNNLNLCFVVLLEYGYSNKIYFHCEGSWKSATLCASVATHCGSACQAIVSHQAVTSCHTALGEAYAPCGAVLLVEI